MKREDISGAIGQISTQYIVEAHEFLKGRYTKNIITWGAITASIGLVLLGGFTMLQQKEKNPWPVKEIVVQKKSQNETAVIPRWDEMTISQQYNVAHYHEDIYIVHG